MQTLATPSIAIIFPAFNEEQTIGSVILEFFKALPEAMFYIIDNNSNDNTSEVAQATLRDNGIAGKVIFERRQGKANAVRRAFQTIDADAYLLVDADLTYPAFRALEMLAPILADSADLVVGDRHSTGHYTLENKRPFHGIGNALVRVLINRIFRAKLTDIMSGYRAMSREFVKNYPVLVEGFEIETEMTLHALDKRFRILELPIEYKDRPPGSLSKLSTFSDGSRVVMTIFQIFRYYRPLLFFVSLGVFIALLGLTASLPVFSDWIRFRYIYHVPLAVLSASLGIVSVLMFSIGLILDSVVRLQKANFELMLLAQTRHQRD
jgi:glycosyltransferase involved in cell wall biosynthesis